MAVPTGGGYVSPMGIGTKIGSVVAALALSVGVAGMARATPSHEGVSSTMMSSHKMAGMHDSMTSSDTTVHRLTKRAQARILARGSLPTLRGRVTDAARIRISSTSVPSGRYRLVVRDETTRHNWHITGSGVDKKTQVTTTGRYVWRVTLSKGSYHIQCDRHPATMHKTLTVT